MTLHSFTRVVPAQPHYHQGAHEFSWCFIRKPWATFGGLFSKWSTHCPLVFFPLLSTNLSLYKVNSLFKYISVLSCQPMVHSPNHWVSLRSTSTKGKQTLVISPEVPHLFSQSSSPHIHVAVIRTKSELEARLGEEKVLSLTFTAAWELLNTRASVEVELKKPKQAPSEAARHTLHTELEQQVLLYRPQSCLDKKSIFR